jgi:hypothetical protein
VTVLDFLDKGGVALTTRDEQDRESLYLEVHETMRTLGAKANELRWGVSPESRQPLSAVMHALFDGPYEVLVRQATNEWPDASATVVARLAELRARFVESTL